MSLTAPGRELEKQLGRALTVLRMYKNTQKFVPSPIYPPLIFRIQWQKADSAKYSLLVCMCNIKVPASMAQR